MPINRQQRVDLRNRPVKSRILYQEWRHLLFLHWKYDPEEIQKTLPKGLYVDTFNGNAYITLVPFFIQNLKISTLPTLPFFSDFIEVNVRTYVYRNGIPGIWFYSLDINSLLAAMVARQFFGLPYQGAKLTSKITTKEISISGNRNKTTMDFQFLPKNGFKVLEIDSLDFFLLERYVLFSSKNHRLYRNDLKNRECVKEAPRFLSKLAGDEAAKLKKFSDGGGTKSGGCPTPTETDSSSCFGIYRQRIHHAPYFMSDVELKNCNGNLLESNQFYCNQTTPEIVHYCNALNVDFFPLEAAD
jgi:uncharacterized protein